MMFDNNCPEAMNASLKTWMENRRKDVSQVVSDILGFVMEQHHDIGKAFTEMSGPYVLKDEYDAAKMPPNFWTLSPSRRRLFLDDVADVPMNPLDNEEVSTDSVTRELPRLTEKFPTEQVDALKVKVERILNGNICQGFHGHKSRIVPSESGSLPHVIKCIDEHKYVCSTPCLQYKTHNLCSHSLAAAADNHDLNCFVTLYLSKNNTSNLTAASMANVSRHAGKKPGRTTRKRNKTKESVILTQRATLGELLRDIPPDCSQLQYSAQSCDGNELKVKLTSVSTPRPEKPVVHPTEKTLVELIETSGNIQKCAGCRGDLKGGPQSQVAVGVSVQNLESQYCLRHKEEDYFFVSKTNQWIKKFENKHYHVNRQCIVGRNPNFQPNNVHLSLPKKFLGFTVTMI